MVGAGGFVIVAARIWVTAAAQLLFLRKGTAWLAGSAGCLEPGAAEGRDGRVPAGGGQEISESKCVIPGPASAASPLG